ncbi:MAG TPA: hypothetical protein VE760_04810 [Acidimicrobiales bacterium]|nr:hypothetical protein [Acidimicrobiales bacterium]
MPTDGERGESQEVEGFWEIRNGEPVPKSGPDPWRDDGRENLQYSNPFGQDIERVWFDGKVVYAVELGELELDLSSTKVAQEYQIVYSVELDESGKPVREPERVPGQYNIYDSVPGMDNYSPLWQFNYVIVPRDYEANTLRSEADCLASGHPIERSTVVEN